MGHATQATVAKLAPLIDQVRALGIDGLEVKENGRVYRKRSGILHFHEDATGVQADVKVNGIWQRVDVNTAAGRRQVVRLLREHYCR